MMRRAFRYAGAITLLTVGPTVMATGCPSVSEFEKSCASDAECDDGNLCTKDACVGGKCLIKNDDSIKPSDGKPCTEDICKSGVESHPPKSGNAPCGDGSNLKCDGNGECSGCESTKMGADCGEPGPGSCVRYACKAANCVEVADQGKVVPDSDNNECTINVCDANGIPQPSFAPAKTTCTVNGGAVCDAMGHCVECVDNGQCAMNSTKPVCVQQHCASCDGVTLGCIGDPCAMGHPCGSGGTCVDGVCCNMVCNGLCEACAMMYTGLQDGICAPVKFGMDPHGDCTTKGGCGDASNMPNECACNDGKKNGNETDVDCGGSVCSKCPQGSECNTGTDCLSALSCADGVCCESDCTAACRSCALPSSKGKCADVLFAPDADTCSDPKVCGASGSGCRGRVGATCGMPKDCLSGNCTSQGCGTGGSGKSCIDDSDCANGQCQNNTCP